MESKISPFSASETTFSTNTVFYPFTFLLFYFNMHSVDSHGYINISIENKNTNNGTKHVDLCILTNGDLSITQGARNFITP